MRARAASNIPAVGPHHAGVPVGVLGLLPPRAECARLRDIHTYPCAHRAVSLTATIQCWGRTQAVKCPPPPPPPCRARECVEGMYVHKSERIQGPRDPVPSQGEGFQAQTSAGASENDVAGRVCPPQDLLGADQFLHSSASYFCQGRVGRTRGAVKRKRTTLGQFILFHTWRAACMTWQERLATWGEHHQSMPRCRHLRRRERRVHKREFILARPG